MTNHFELMDGNRCITQAESLEELKQKFINYCFDRQSHKYFTEINEYNEDGNLVKAFTKKEVRNLEDEWLSEVGSFNNIRENPAREAVRREVL